MNTGFLASVELVFRGPTTWLTSEPTFSWTTLASRITEIMQDRMHQFSPQSLIMCLTEWPKLCDPTLTLYFLIPAMGNVFQEKPQCHIVKTFKVYKIIGKSPIKSMLCYEWMDKTNDSKIKYQCKSKSSHHFSRQRKSSPVIRCQLPAHRPCLGDTLVKNSWPPSLISTTTWKYRWETVAMLLNRRYIAVC